MLRTIRRHWLHRSQAGVTLTQLLMTIAISGVGLGAALTLLTLGQRHAQRGDTVTGLQQESRSTMELVVRDLREAAVDSVLITGDQNSVISFASARDEESVYTLNASGWPAWQKAIVYYLRPGTTELYRYTTEKTSWTYRFDPVGVVEEGLGERISQQVSQLSFTLDGTLVQIAMEMLEETDSGATTINRLTTDTVVRNEL